MKPKPKAEVCMGIMLRASRLKSFADPLSAMRCVNNGRSTGGLLILQMNDSTVPLTSFAQLARSEGRMSSRAIADAIAKKIMAKSQKRFSSLHDEAVREVFMSTPTSSNGVNTTAAHEQTLDRSRIGSPADGRKLNATGSQGVTINSGLNVGQNSEVKPITVKPVDSKTITGSYAGDHRSPSRDTVKESLNRAADNGGPRSAVGQFKGSKFEQDSAPASTNNFEGIGA